ncbi:MAG: hypothetical protein WC683_20170 [bacterium]|jgi:hypothetical protein
MDRKDHVILRKDYLLLQFKYVKLKEEIERFLKKKSGYRELRERLKEMSS